MDRKDYQEQRVDRGCKFWDWCENCPYPRCRYDNPAEKYFLAPIRYQFIRTCYKIFPNIHVIESVFHVGKSTIYKALNEDEK